MSARPTPLGQLALRMWPHLLARQKHSNAALVALISLAYGIALWASIMILLGPPRLFVVLDVQRAGSARIAWVRAGSNLWDQGVRSGDPVLRLDGRSPRSHDTGVWRGERLDVRQPGGHATIVDAGIMQRGHNTWPLVLLSPWFLLLGTLVFLRARPPSVGRATYALFATAAGALVVAPAANSDDPVAALTEFALVSLFAACFAIFFLAFPTPRGTVRRYVAILAPPFVAIALNLASLVWPTLFAVSSLLRLALLLVYLVLGVALLISAFRTTTKREVRHGLLIMGGSTASAVLPFVALYLVPTLLNQPSLMASEHAILALALLPAGFTYAILRYNVLDVHLLQRWLVHSLLWTGLLASYALFLITTRRWLLDGLPEPARSVGLAAIFALLAALSFGWLRGRLQRLLDGLIFKDAYDYCISLQQLSKDLSLAGNLDTLGATLPDTLCQLMNLDFAILLIHHEQRARVGGVAGVYQPDMLSTLVAATRAVTEAPTVVSLAGGCLSVLLIPLRTHDTAVGHLCLGPKASGEPFRAEDNALLATLSGHLAAIVRNTYLVDDLRQKVAALDMLNERLQSIQEEERARLAADLHDEPLQTALFLQRQLTAAAALNNVPVPLVQLSQTLTIQLRSLCTSMRPAILDDLGLHAALHQLAHDLSTRTGLPILLDADSRVAELDLSPAMELVLYRSAQEAVNNCLRHAHARTVQVSLQCRENGVQLLVADDGVGFAVPTRLDDLVQAGHLGLAGLRERVHHAGGRLCVVSAPRAGTVVQVDLPCEWGRV